MEPLSLTAGAIATFILIGLANGALQRTGELMMDKSIEQGQKIMCQSSLQCYFPRKSGNSPESAAFK